MHHVGYAVAMLTALGCAACVCVLVAGGELFVTPETAAAYETGHGSVVLRATAHVEYEGSKRKKKRAASEAQDATAAAAAQAEAAAAGDGKALIVFTEMPYQVCKVSWEVLQSVVVWICMRPMTCGALGSSLLVQHPASLGLGAAFVSHIRQSITTPSDNCACVLHSCQQLACIDGWGVFKSPLSLLCVCCGVLQSDLVTRIAEMVDAKQLDGISDVRDESDRTGKVY